MVSLNPAKKSFEISAFAGTCYSYEGKTETATATAKVYNSHHMIFTMTHNLYSVLKNKCQIENSIIYMKNFHQKLTSLKLLKNNTTTENN